MTGPVLVGLDGSDNAAAALAWARVYTEATGADLVAIHALGLLERTPGGDLEPSQRHRDEINARYNNLAAPAPCVVHDGDPVSVMLAEADRVDASLIVVGTRGAGSAGANSLGSTSAQLALGSSCPVVIVPSA